jgi:hypothetical protein
MCHSSASRSSRPARSNPARILCLVVLVLLVAAACSDDDGEGAAGREDFPDWVVDVFPEPNATVAVTDIVEVQHRLVDPEHEIRLLIDGVDVTARSEMIDDGTLRYDAKTGAVDLGTGRHAAEVQRVLLPVDEIEGRVVDSFTWEFRTA